MIFLVALTKKCPNKMLISAIDNIHVVGKGIFLEQWYACLSFMEVLATFDLFSKIGLFVIYRPESEKYWFRKRNFLTF